MKIEILETSKISKEQILNLYKLNGWSAVKKPELLLKGLLNSHTLVTAWQSNKLIGLGNAISDGALVVYYPHLLIHPNFQGLGVGRMIVEKLQKKYHGFHMQILTSDKESIGFYNKLGFDKAGSTQAMWIYSGDEH